MAQVAQTPQKGSGWGVGEWGVQLWLSCQAGQL